LRLTGSPGASGAETDSSWSGKRTCPPLDTSRATRGAFPASPDPRPRAAVRAFGSSQSPLTHSFPRLAFACPPRRASRRWRSSWRPSGARTAAAPRTRTP
jgi:hypothetical protein